MSVDGQQRAREATRASLTARLHGMADTWPHLLAEAAKADPAAMIGELSTIALTAVRVAAVVLGLPAEELLAALLVARAAVEPAEQARRQASG